jgi:anti-anti-sigma factor
MDTAAESNLHYSLEAQRDGCSVFHLSGELDACTAALVEEAMGPRLKGSEEPLVVDLRDLEFIDSTGIRLLLTLVQQRLRGGTVTLVRPKAGVARKALDLVGLSRVIPTVDDLAEALRRRPNAMEPGAGAF